MSAHAALLIRRRAPARSVVVRRPQLSLATRVRPATAADATAIHALIADHLEEGRLLPRALDEITAHVDRFVVAVHGRRVIGCADLTPLSDAVAEVRSLVVDAEWRSHGAGSKIIDALKQKAADAGFDRLCAFTHSPGYFVRIGFSLVPHSEVPEKIEADCRACPKFGRCGQYAAIFPLCSVRLQPDQRSVRLQPDQSETEARA